MKRYQQRPLRPNTEAIRKAKGEDDNMPQDKGVQTEGEEEPNPDNAAQQDSQSLGMLPIDMNTLASLTANLTNNQVYSDEAKSYLETGLDNPNNITKSDRELLELLATTENVSMETMTMMEQQDAQNEEAKKDESGPDGRRSLLRSILRCQRQALSIRSMEPGQIEDKLDNAEPKPLVTAKDKEVKSKKDVTKLN